MLWGYNNERVYYVDPHTLDTPYCFLVVGRQLPRMARNHLILVGGPLSAVEFSNLTHYFINPYLIIINI